MQDVDVSRSCSSLAIESGDPNLYHCGKGECFVHRCVVHRDCCVQSRRPKEPPPFSAIAATRFGRCTSYGDTRDPCYRVSSVLTAAVLLLLLLLLLLYCVCAVCLSDQCACRCWARGAAARERTGAHSPPHSCRSSCPFSRSSSCRNRTSMSQV